jgi:hypothetical protein
VSTLQRARPKWNRGQPPSPRPPPHEDRHGVPLPQSGPRQVIFERDRRCTRQVQNSEDQVDACLPVVPTISLIVR